MLNDWIVPDWPAPANVRAVSTTRSGGVSSGVYASLNLGAHVGDSADAVDENRRRVRNTLNLSVEPRWVKQVHSAHIVQLDGSAVTEPCDAAFTHRAGETCVIMTADCLPVLFCDRAGKTIAAAHAGWRGMATGILETTVAAMQVPAHELLAWLGPAIGPGAYEVGEEVRVVLIKEHPETDEAFEPTGTGKWLCNLYLLASQRLRYAGIKHVYGGGFCTFSEPERFFSYRRDGECGRMGTLIWLAST
ncbi:MAG: peptidoglycan editing factor PgeF [Gammaproteobacteria bacterium]